MNAPARVLIVCLRYLGDTLLLRPPLRALRVAFPEARLDVLVTAGTGVALEGCADVDLVLEWPRSSLPAGVGLCLKVLLARYDWVVDFTGNDRSAFVALLSMAPLRLAYERQKSQRRSIRSWAFNVRPQPRRPKPHVLHQRLELLGAVGVVSAGTACGLVPGSAAVGRMEVATSALGRPRLHVHPTSRDMQKALPRGVLRAVVGSALSEGWGVVITTGADKAERLHVAEALGGLARQCAVFSDLAWHDLVGLISLAECYWGADTAPGHVASALEIPARIEFGPSSAKHWGPLHAAGCAVVHSCACREESPPRCPRGVPGRCLDAIEADEVMHWVRQSVVR